MLSIRRSQTLMPDGSWKLFGRKQRPAGLQLPLAGQTPQSSAVPQPLSRAPHSVCRSRHVLGVQQALLKHTSLALQLELCTQPVAGSQASFVQLEPSSQEMAGPDTHEPPE